MNIKGHTFKGAIFDIDGTLIDSMPIWDQLGARYLVRRDVTPAPDLGKILFPMTIEEGVRYIRETYQLPEPEEQIRAGLMEELRHFYVEEVPLKPGAENLVRQLAQEGIPMVLASIGDRELEEAALRRLGILDFFQDMFFCEDYCTTKRESTIYLVCAEHLGINPEDLIVFEDILQAVRSAKRAGFYTIAVYDATSSADAESMRREADLYLRSFEELCEDMLSTS